MIRSGKTGMSGLLPAYATMQMIFNHPAMLYRSIDHNAEKASGSNAKAREASAYDSMDDFMVEDES